MAARPPPTRPHISLNPPSHFSYSTTEWGEDDAWDSASDPDPRPSGMRSTSTTTTTASQTLPKPVPVPRKSQNSSSSTLAFSYTHVSAPSPRARHTRPTRTRSLPPPRRMAGRSDGDGPDDKATVAGHQHAYADDHDGDGGREGGSDADNHDDMTFDDLGAEFVDMPVVRSARLNAACVRKDAAEIANDPLRLLTRLEARNGRAETSSSHRSRSSSPRYGEPSEKLRREQSFKANRHQKFIECLSCEDGYLPLPTRLRSSTLERKRGEYQSLVDLTFAKGKDALDQQIWHQIEIDVPRTRPGVPLWMHSSTQRCLERILYVWAIRHPASGYVQGINDLVTPFFEVFLSAYLDTDPEEVDPSMLPPPVLAAVEADSFWCLSRLLDGIQDNYITAQPGIQRSVKRMAELVARIDAPLSEHLAAQGVEFMQFAFRWMNCLLMREISVKNTVRMWDTYLAEGPDAFSQFHLYVCSAFLVRWSEKLREMDFQGIIMFLQSLPTQDWTDDEIEMLLSQAFVLNSIWHNAQSHFTGK
ncbi:rab-GTPase-TBC domain-containing protein [Russula compacta]|nr:rab-GTPase-TBC domain-containing protein [Russula compacta]